MIPYYYRITRYQARPGEFKVSPVASSSRIDRLQAHPDQDPVGIPLENQTKPQPAKNKPLSQVDTGEFHLMEPPAQPFPAVDWHDALKRHADHTLGAQAHSVLAVVRGSEDAFLFWALKISVSLEAQIKILAVGTEKDTGPLLDQISRIIAAYHGAGHPDALVKTKPEILWSRDGESLNADFIRETATHGTSLILLDGRSEDPAAVHQVHCPVLWLKGAQSPFDIRHILIAMDADTPSYHLIHQGITLCRLFGAGLHLMHVSPTPEGENEALAQLEKISKLIQWHGVSHDTFVSHGGITRDILDYADTHSIDLIVMGTHHFNAEGQTSIAEGVLKESQCPVFILHPYGG